MNSNYEWVKFYSAFADKLLEYETNRIFLLEKLQSIFNGLGMKFQKLEEDGSVVDIDPFTVFGMFNKGLSEANRISIIRAFAKEFDIDKTIEIPTVFDGIPTLNNLKAVFFGWAGWTRQDSDIDNLWLLFKTALKYADATDKSQIKDSFVDIYDAVAKQSCVKWNITMGLFWIRPYAFVNLDLRMRWYIKEYCPELVDGRTKTFKDVPDGETYLWLSETISKKLSDGGLNYKSLPELSYAAYIESEHVNQKNKRGGDGENTAIVDEDANARHYWLYAPGRGGEKWEEFYEHGIMAIGWGEIGDLSQFTDRNQIKVKMKETYDPDRPYKNDSLATWQFAKEIKVGDVIFVKKGMHQIIGRGTVESGYIYDPSQSDGYNNVRKVKWTHNGVWQHPGQAVLKTLTDITQYTEYVETLKSLFDNAQGEEIEEKEIKCDFYSPEKFLEDVYMSEDEYNTLVDLVLEKKNVILQGAPGVGKTFAAKRLAYSMMGVQDSERVMMIQFHQSYSYEDFIMGYRPTESGGFVLKKGPFYNFCKKADEDEGNEYFFIIDEINRGNLSKIFGELFMLIEADKREDCSLRLLYSDEMFSVPENLYIIGMMNTADRSLAMLDYALRRRFAFYEMKPGFESKQFIEYRMKLNNPKFDSLINTVESLNDTIASDDALGDGFKIGHSYFCNIKETTDARLSNIVEYELIPMLKEYWFDDPTKVKDWSNLLRSAIK